ncbi:MAG: efflux RND transporter permease subunit [Acidobacteria bacterium]|nr:efflux RND transporter permease subunit [Acidobacteriota bacterium]
MIDRLIEWCAYNKALVLLIVAVTIVMGIRSMRNIPLDAIPDLSDTQVIVFSRWDRSPNIIEDQVTYPIIRSMLGVPKVKDIRGFSDFGFSYVYIVFEEGTDIYWARSRTLEYLNNILPKLPEGVSVELARDETAVGWVYQYVLVDQTGKRNLADLRSLQDWQLRYELQSVPGVAEVSPLGGFIRQYQVNLDPNALTAYQIPIDKVIETVRQGNNEVGGRLVEFSGREYMVRGRGYIRSKADIEQLVVAVNRETGTPVLIKQLGKVVLGPDLRRGVGEFNGEGEAAGAIVIMRVGENALNVIAGVKAKLAAIEASLPPGVTVVTTYDRSELIRRSIDTLKETLIEELTVVSLIILIFLLHVPSALIPVITICVAVVIAFIPMEYLGVTANIMSISGIAIAVGAMVDAAIVVVEQIHKKLEEWEAQGRPTPRHTVIIHAAKEVGAPSFYSLLVIGISFLPIIALEAQEGRLFKPLAFTKNLSMVMAAILSVTLVPAIAVLLIRTDRFRFRPRWVSSIVNAVLVGKIYSEEQHPLSRWLMRLYQPVVEWVLRHQWLTILGAVLVVALTLPIYFRLGSEFMPPLDEGTLLYMPTTLPGISITEAQRLLQIQDRIIKSFPEVKTVHGKAGRAETATDPAPFSMMETVIVLKPASEWPKIPRWYSAWAPEWLQNWLRRAWPDHQSTQELIYGTGGLNEALQIPGTVNAWTMPIKARIDMLTTGVRTPVGIKILGPDLTVIEHLGQQIEAALRPVRGTASVYAERTAGGYFIDFEVKRTELARYGLTVAQVEMVIMSAIGGESVSTTIEGRERYPINVRNFRDYRSTLADLRRIRVPTMGGPQIPLEQLADLKIVTGPGMIRNENGRLSGYVYVDVAGRDVGGFVTDAKEAVRAGVQIPPGYTLTWSGQYESMERVANRLLLVIPITLLVIVLLLYLNTQSLVKTSIVLLAVPFSAIGAIWLLYFLDYNVSIAVWVGLIALLGVDAETGVFMLLYLDLAYEEAKSQGKLNTRDQLHQAIVEGAVKRLRPKLMTVMVDYIGLLPVLWATGTGSDTMKRIAVPLVGGMLTSFLLELVVYPAIYEVWRWYFHVRKEAAGIHQPDHEPAPTSVIS